MKILRGICIGRLNSIWKTLSPSWFQHSVIRSKTNVIYHECIIRTDLSARSFPKRSIRAEYVLINLASVREILAEKFYLCDFQTSIKNKSSNQMRQSFNKISFNRSRWGVPSPVTEIGDFGYVDLSY